MTHCLIDNSNIINISYSVFVNMMHKDHGDDYVIKESDLGLFWHLYVHKIKDFITSYKDVIFCGEGLNSTKWRREKYPPYKENRKARKENPDYDYISDVYRNVDSFLELLGYQSLKTEGCEADDEIYKLSEYFTSKGDEVLIVSADRDLTQIMNYFDGVTVFSPMKFHGGNLERNENIVLEKALVGDTADNISGVPRIGKKTFEKMIADKSVWNEKMTEKNQELFDIILEVVDLRKYPKEFQDAIISNYENNPRKPLDVTGVEKFYLDHGLNQCLREWSDLSAEIMAVSNNDSILDAENELEDLLNSI